MFVSLHDKLDQITKKVKNSPCQRKGDHAEQLHTWLYRWSLWPPSAVFLTSYRSKLSNRTWKQLILSKKHSVEGIEIGFTRTRVLGQGRPKKVSAFFGFLASLSTLNSAVSNNSKAGGSHTV